MVGVPRELARERFQFFGSGVSGSLVFRLVPPGSDLTGLGGGLLVGVRFPLRPFTLAFRNLPLLVSVTVTSLLTGVPAVVVAARPLLPRPLGVRDSISLVGESQNLAGREGREAGQLTQKPLTPHTTTLILDSQCDKDKLQTESRVLSYKTNLLLSYHAYILHCDNS